jgi:hypothetical protein
VAGNPAGVTRGLVSQDNKNTRVTVAGDPAGVTRGLVSQNNSIMFQTDDGGGQPGRCHQHKNLAQVESVTHPFLHAQVFGGVIVRPLTRKWGVGHIVSKINRKAIIRKKASIPLED